MTEQRRVTDNAPQLDIELMIAAEDDPKQRTFLIVLNSINTSLTANTRVTTEVSKKLEAHLVNFETHSRAEEAFMNKGRGAWMIMGGVFALLQFIGAAIWYDVSGKIVTFEQSIVALTAKDAVFETRITVLESKK